MWELRQSWGGDIHPRHLGSESLCRAALCVWSRPRLQLCRLTPPLSLYHSFSGVMENEVLYADSSARCQACQWCWVDESRISAVTVNLAAVIPGQVAGCLSLCAQAQVAAASVSEVPPLYITQHDY